MHMITFLHMVNAHADDLSNCLELMKWMFFVLYSKQQNVFLPHLDEVLDNPSLTLATPPRFSRRYYLPRCFCLNIISVFCWLFASCFSEKTYYPWVRLHIQNAAATIYRFYEFSSHSQSRSKGLPCLFGHLFIYSDFLCSAISLWSFSSRSY